MLQKIKIEKEINANIERVFEAFINPKDLVNWYRASDDWSTPYAEVDPVVGGIYKIRFEDPTGEHSFDYIGEFTDFTKPNLIEYKLGDERSVRIELEELSINKTLITESFDAENENGLEMQKQGWTMILNNLEKYLDSKNK